jgi:hypothetical protein
MKREYPVYRLLATALAAPERAYGTEEMSKCLSFWKEYGQRVPTIARFVEVKKPEEPASAVQLAEIDYLNGLGLHARVLRLIEA